MKNYWLLKSEPEVYSIDNLAKDKTTWWEGVRNYQARNFMIHEMKLGDLVFFYHSNAEPPGIAGLARVSLAAAPDPTQFQKKSDYFDAKATIAKPIWFCVQVEFQKRFKKLISLDELRQEKDLQGMMLLRKGQRLSVQPVSPQEFAVIQNLAHQ